MNFDFHVHGSLSSKLGFDLDFFQQMTREAKEAGLDGLALTDHFDAADYQEIHQILADRYRYVDDYYEINGLRVFHGIEVEVSEGMHLLVIGNREHMNEYYQRLDGHFEPDHYCSTQQFFHYQEGLNTIAIAAHPFRPNRLITQIDPIHYPKFDAMGLNARDLYFLGAEELLSLTQNFSNEHHLPILAGSDTHHFLQIGSIMNRFPGEAATINELRKMIQSNTHEIVINEALQEKIRHAREEKSAIKAARLGN